MSARIAMVGACPYPVPQGSQVYLRACARALTHSNHEVHLVTYGHSAATSMEADPFPIHRAPHIPGYRRTAAGPSLLKPVADAALVRTLHRVVRDYHIDVVCAHNYEGLAVALAAGKRPVIYFAHNLLGEELPAYFPTVGARLFSTLGIGADRWLPRRANAVVVPHARLAEELVALGCSSETVHIVPPSVEAHAFEQCKIEDTCPPVLYTGNLDRYQNLPLLFEAMHLVRKEIPTARLIIASAAEVNVDNAEYVHTPDFNSLRTVLKQDAVIAVPRVSWSGYPIKLLNAMAAGHACVACESAAAPLNHESNGLIVADNNVTDFAKELLCCMQNKSLREQLGKQARADIESHHSIEVISHSLDLVINMML